MEQAKNGYGCNNCQRVFHKKNEFTLHTSTCIKPQKGQAFQNLLLREQSEIKKTNLYRKPDKILPPSQPLSTSESNMEESGGVILDDTSKTKEASENKTANETKASLANPSNSGNVNCTHCDKSFTKRGLSKHMRSCKRKNTPHVSMIDTEDVPLAAQTSVETTDTETLEPAMKVWGNHSTDELTQIINSIYEEIVFWRKNLFKLPSGAAGKLYIKEITRLIQSWNEDKAISNISLKMVMIMPAILLQKPSKKSTSKQHTEYLGKRLDLWSEGNFDILMKESRSIQERLKQNMPKQPTVEEVSKRFAKLMLQGKVNAALRLIESGSPLGIAELDEKLVNELRNLHPEAKSPCESTLAQGELPFFDPVVFTNIDEQSIAKAALRTRGGAGPSGMDADGWKRIIISKNYGSTGKDLRTAIARMTQKLCTRDITNLLSLESYLSCRLIPLEKEPSGIRPIGIGEVLRRIIGKAVVTEIKPDIIESGGCLQLCTGMKAGCEAAAHAMKDIFDEEETDAVLFVDASNAFNSMNRHALLHNIQYLCPPMAKYVRNCYTIPSRLFIGEGKEILSSEGTTQGDPLAMPAYGIGILPLLIMIKHDDPALKHLAYADDIGAGSRLHNLRCWWDSIADNGPKLGYYPKASKSWLVVKKEKFEEATLVFEGTGVNITTEGRKYLGGFVGTEEGSEKYVKSLMKDWLDELERLSKIAKSEPQAAYSAFTAGFRHKVTYFIRTIPNLEEVLKPLDQFIDSNFIPAITEGHVMSDNDRSLVSLPVRLGGLGIPVFTEICRTEYENSRLATQFLRPKIIAQEQLYVVDRKGEQGTGNIIKARNERRQQDLLTKLRADMSKEKLRGNDLAQMKGASAWLTSLPLKEEGFVLNKREFFDALALRYRWDVKRLPMNCACGKKFDIDHAMSCMKGGYVHRRHDQLRDLFARLLDTVANEVQTEPALQPLTGEQLPTGANCEDEARLDISARGFWQRCEMAYFDVRVFNPFAKTHLNSTIQTAFRSNETMKKRAYNERIIQVEHGSFTPIVFSSFGGCGLETGRFVSKLIEKLSSKNDFSQSIVGSYVRAKVSFELVRSQVASIRGSRQRKKMEIDTGQMEIVTNSAIISE